MPKEKNKMKKFVIPVLLSVLLIFTSCGKKSIATKIATARTELSVQQLKTQIDDLSLHISAQYSLLSELQTQLKANSEINTTPVVTTPLITTTTILTPTTTPATPNEPSNAEISNDIDFLTTNIKNLADKVTALEDQVQTLQENQAGNATNIGITSTTLNGLVILFITNNIDVGATGSTTPTSAQFAIKITNTTNSIVSNLDITGTINSVASFSGIIATGYPQVIDGGGSATLTSSYAGDKTVLFEAYSGGKGLTIPVGASITIRPKVSILASSTNKLPATTFVIAVNAITYDKQ
jgi:hypothetical protein